MYKDEEKDFVDCIRAAVYTVGALDYRLRFVNQGLLELIPDIKAGDLCYRALWGKDMPCHNCPCKAILDGEKPESRVVHCEKAGRYLSIDGVLIESAEDHPQVLFTGYDVSCLAGEKEYFRKIAYYDAQLNMKNRVAFMNDLAEEYEAGHTGWVCIVSIKNINNFNLVYGRSAGDDLLKKIAGFYLNTYSPDHIYRIGGTKLALVARREIEYRMLQNIIRQDIPGAVMGDGGNSRLFMDSVIINYPAFADQPEEVIHNADYMLHRTKSQESSRVLYFQTKEQEELTRSRKISSIIRKKMGEEQFIVYFQPIVEIKTGRFVKCEALLRLYDEELGWISPVEFIPVAEENGLIYELGRLVLEKACQEIAYRKKHGLYPVCINVNVSTVQFSRRSFCEDVISIVEKYDIDPKLIQLEVTESIIINSFEYTVDIMKRLIEYGLSFAVDDFGTGYSSLSYIGTLPVECLKLDKSFVDRVAESEVYVLIVNNVIEIARGLKFKIVAEGVESRSQYEILKRLGCDYIQGYLFARPLPADRFEAFLQDNDKDCNL